MKKIPAKNNNIRKNKFKPGEIKDLVLAAIGISVVMGGSIFITPNFPIICGMIIKLVQELKQIKIPEAKIKRTLKQLEKRKLISLEEYKGEVAVKVLENGKEHIFKYSIKNLLDMKKKEKKWEGKWFLVFFDVPEVKKKKREYLRNFLKEIGFYPYQKSVYIFPYECESEIKHIKKMIEAASYMSYIVAEKIEYENDVKRYFNI